jgi:hypothetical protein
MMRFFCRALVEKGSPNGFEIHRESGEQGRICDRCDLGGIVGGDLIFDLRRSFERLVPASTTFDPLCAVDNHI